MLEGLLGGAGRPLERQRWAWIASSNGRLELAVRGPRVQKGN